MTATITHLNTAGRKPSAPPAPEVPVVDLREPSTFWDTFWAVVVTGYFFVSVLLGFFPY